VSTIKHPDFGYVLKIGTFFLCVKDLLVTTGVEITF
jgi:hypothetical protein